MLSMSSGCSEHSYSLTAGLTGDQQQGRVDFESEWRRGGFIPVDQGSGRFDAG
jgi:hypothetical protein